MRSVRFLTSLTGPLAAAAVAAAAPPVSLTPVELEAVGRRVWENEAGGQREGLVAWNRGEAFASLGIGHFLWFPAGLDAPYRESFPALLRSLVDQGVTLPGWLRPDTPCPWPTRAAFLEGREDPRVRDLRDLLDRTFAEQTRFIVARAARALPEVVEAAAPATRPTLRARIDALRASPEGTFALLDYVNFKGEGTDPAERHGAVGWGLLQVLQDMGEDCPVRAFRDAAKRILTRRVLASPGGREARWLRGWLVRCDRYLRPLLPGRAAPCPPGGTGP